MRAHAAADWRCSRRSGSWAAAPRRNARGDQCRPLLWRSAPGRASVGTAHHDPQLPTPCDAVEGRRSARAGNRLELPWLAGWPARSPPSLSSASGFWRMRTCSLLIASPSAGFLPRIAQRIKLPTSAWNSVAPLASSRAKARASVIGDTGFLVRGLVIVLQTGLLSERQCIASRRSHQCNGRTPPPRNRWFVDSPLEGAGFEPSVPQSNRSFGDDPNRPPGPLLLYGKMRFGRQIRPAVRIPFAPPTSPSPCASFVHAAGTTSVERLVVFLAREKGGGVRKCRGRQV